MSRLGATANRMPFWAGNVPAGAKRPGGHHGKDLSLHNRGRLFYIVVRPISDADADAENLGNAPAIGFYAEFSENAPKWLTAEFVSDAHGKCRVFNTSEALTAAKEVIGHRVGGGEGAD